jgi:hypothetical protein
MHYRLQIIRIIFLLLISNTASFISKSQTVTVLDSAVIQGTTVVIAGNEYDKSGFHKLWWGKHYRPEWITPIRAKNFYLDTAKGGLVPSQVSGSRQSTGLRLKNKEGKEFVLRSIDKDFGNGLGDLYKGTFIARIAKDQSSIGHPYAAPTIAAMIRPTGIYHTNPQIVFVPKQPILGEYNEKFGDQLYLFEERPDENQEDVPTFGRSKNVIGTEKLREHIYDDNDNHVDQKAFAKARLFDMVVGDWGRHADQWRWAEFENEKETIYKPIPRDRDQVYTKFDGIIPWFATSVFGASFLESFDGQINNVRDFNRPGRPLDKQFLTELTKQQWIDIAKELQAVLTDSLIEYGVRQMPAEIFALSGEKIIADLKGRRNQLDKTAVSYYNYLSKYIDILGSNKTELIEVDRINDEETAIRIYKITKENEVKNKPYYSRVFKKSETKEIRLYGLESADKFRFIGNANKGVRVRIIDPEKLDSIGKKQDRLTKISRGIRFGYDTLYEKNFDFFVRPVGSAGECDVIQDDPLQLFTRTGIKSSANVRFYTKPWKKKEYDTWHVLSANYGFLRQTFFLGYVGTLQKLVGKWDVLLKARWDAPAVENFYGLGNESPDPKFSATYYRTSSRRLYGGVSLSRNFGQKHHFDIGPFYQRVKVDKFNDPYVLTAYLDDGVFSPRHFAGVEAGYSFTNVNSIIYPTKGVHFVLGGGYVQNLNDKDRAFAKINSSFAFYVPVSKSFTLAVRVGGGTLAGEADYYHMNTLSGNENLRGYPRERFFGKSSFYNNNELRWVTNTRNIVFNGKIGLMGFVDQGRVWEPGEQSNTWHTGYGGGVILIPFNKVTLVGTYGVSKEGWQTLLKATCFF